MKNKKESIIQGIVALLFSQILIKIIGLVYKLYLTNREGFGDTGNAIYSSGFQIYALLLTFSSTGVPNAISKLVSERLAIGDTKGAHRIFKISFFTFALFGIVGTILLFLSARRIANVWLQIPEAEYSLIALSPSIFFVSITSVIRGYFNGRQNLSATAKSQSIEQIFKTVFTIILVETVVALSKVNTTLMAAAANLATTIATLFSFSYIYLYYRKRRKEIGQEIKQSVNYKVTRIRKTIKMILNESIPISLSALMSSFNKNIDAFTVVRCLKTFINEETAKVQYGILSGKIDTLCILPLSLNVAFVTGMVPSIAKSVAINDNKALRRKVKIFLLITILIAIPSTLGIFIFSKLILKILFPNASSGVLLLRINSISIFFSLIAQTVNSILQGMGKTKIPVLSSIIGVVFKLICNVLLIKNQFIGINGAAIGNIMCNLVVCLISLGFLMTIFKKNKYFQKK
ncbi:MAG: polysaccharide biosynthesis protein, partial [Clostridia bacterium]|nr:polysaccharide biosynthesis protein [Clostridia bacterium]